MVHVLLTLLTAAWAEDPVGQDPPPDGAPTEAPTEAPPAASPWDAPTVDGPIAVPAEDPPPAADPAAPAPDPAPAPSRGRRPDPPGTPLDFQGMRPAPPYARWPAEEGVGFDDLKACEAHFKVVAPGRMGKSIRRFDAVYRRCEWDGQRWSYEEDHAYATLDPILDPLLLVVPPAVLLSDLARRGDSVGRGQERWDVHGDDPDKRQPTWTGPATAKPFWAPLSDGILGVSVAMSFSPLWMSSGNAKGTDFLMMAEVQALSAGIAGSINVRRPEPRPLADADLRGFDDDALWGAYGALQGDGAFRSTVSVHTSVTAGAGFGLATIGLLKDKDRSVGAKVAPFVLAAGLTALEGTARVMSLREDPGDVLSGAAVGVASGVLVPLAHAAIARVIDPHRIQRRQARRQVMVVPTAGAGTVGVAGRF